jgi:hypothetical protein
MEDADDAAISSWDGRYQLKSYDCFTSLPPPPPIDVVVVAPAPDDAAIYATNKICGRLRLYYNNIIR